MFEIVEPSILQFTWSANMFPYSLPLEPVAVLGGFAWCFSAPCQARLVAFQLLSSFGRWHLANSEALMTAKSLNERKTQWSVLKMFKYVQVAKLQSDTVWKNNSQVPFYFVCHFLVLKDICVDNCFLKLLNVTCLLHPSTNTQKKGSEGIHFVRNFWVIQGWQSCVQDF